MGNFNKGGDKRGGFSGGRDGGRPSFRNDSRGGRPERGGDTELFKATCSECGKSCEVPFRPTNGKPVFCKDCFASKRNGEERSPRPSYNSPRPSFDNAPRPSADNGDIKRQLEGINNKLDRLINAMEGAKATPAVKKVEVAKPAKKVEIKAVIKKALAKSPAPKKALAKKGKK